MAGIREEILATCFSRYNGNFAGGQSANNKLDLERIADTELERRILRRMGAFVMRHEPDFVTGVPKGATRLAEAIGNMYGLACVRLDKRDGLITFKTAVDREMCIASERGVLLEDVINRRTSTKRALAIPEIGERVVAVEAIWDRSDDGEREELAVPVHSLIIEPISPILPDESELWEFAA